MDKSLIDNIDCVIEYQKVNSSIKQIIKSLNVKVSDAQSVVKEKELSVPVNSAGCYVPVRDLIILNEFNRSNEFTSNNIILHELIHWTGHSSRLGRPLIQKYELYFMPTGYEAEYEELIAIEGSILMHNCLNLDTENPEYTKNDHIKNIFEYTDEQDWARARIDAQKAVNFIFKKLYQIDTKY